MTIALTATVTVDPADVHNSQFIHDIMNVLQVHKLKAHKAHGESK